MRATDEEFVAGKGTSKGSVAFMNNAGMRLLGWYGVHGRRLPWRQTTDPYCIWISEIMLQQTQVKTVLPRFAVWLDRFPSIDSLADAHPDDVMKAWEGLGYYRRARFVHQAAKQIMALHGGRFPTDFDSILQLPGIGRSTAGAISSFCYGMSAPVLDGNVRRVLRRWHAKLNASDKVLWDSAQQAIDASANPANWNQAMMELGATVCSAKKPDCGNCPVSSCCKSAFSVEEAEEPAKKVAVRDVYWRVDIHTCPERGIWLVRRPDSGIWPKLWTPPISELNQAPDFDPCHVHLLTHRRLHLYGNKLVARPARDGCWFSALSDIAVPTGIHRLLNKCGVAL